MRLYLFCAVPVAVGNALKQTDISKALCGMRRQICRRFPESYYGGKDKIAEYLPLRNITGGCRIVFLKRIRYK